MESSIKKVAIVTVLCSLLVVSVFGLRSWSYGNRVLPTLYFEDIDQGYYCGIPSRAEFVISDNASWGDLWEDLHNTSTGFPDLPTVNFSQEIVIAVFLGTFSTGGYTADIKRIEGTVWGFIVHVEETHPGEGCGLTMALTQPYHIVKANVTSPLAIDFVYNIVIHDCS